MYYSHNEIFNQGDSLKKTLDYILSMADEIRDFFGKDDYDEIVFIACGSSNWLSLSAAETFSEKLKIRCQAVTGGEIVMHPELYQDRYSKPLIIAPTRSGSTSETLTALDFLKKHYGCRVLAITAYPDPPVAKHTDLLLNISWSNETSICQTRSFCNLYLASILMAALVSGDNALESDLAAYISTFPVLSRQTGDLMNTLFTSVASPGNLIVLGQGKLYGLACEGAYISIEMAQAPSWSFRTLEFRHGPIVLLDETFLVVVLSDGPSDNKFESGIIADIKANKSKVLVVSPQESFPEADYQLTFGRSCNTEVTGLAGSLVTQAIAYYRALQRKVDPDNPKDLVPWIKI
jgi:fructoselysine-6-P-deglycase FrlB-like protein